MTTSIRESAAAISWPLHSCLVRRTKAANDPAGEHGHRHKQKRKPEGFLLFGRDKLLLVAKAEVDTNTGAKASGGASRGRDPIISSGDIELGVAAPQAEFHADTRRIVEIRR